MVGKEINVKSQSVILHVSMEIAFTILKLNNQSVAVRMNGKDQLAVNQFVIQFVMHTELAANQEYVNVKLDGKDQDVLMQFVRIVTTEHVLSLQDFKLTELVYALTIG